MALVGLGGAVAAASHAEGVNHVASESTERDDLITLADSHEDPAVGGYLDVTDIALALAS